MNAPSEHGEPSEKAGELPARPVTRGDCANMPRPCPYVSCAHHLYLDVREGTGTIKLNFPGREVWELTHSCALDVADEGAHTLEQIGAIVNLTRERVRQVEVMIFDRLRPLLEPPGGTDDTR